VHARDPGTPYPRTPCGARDPALAKDERGRRHSFLRRHLGSLKIPGLDQGFQPAAVTAWGRFTLARIWLSLRGELPWRVMPL
jgi:hypothetical protein